MDQTMPLDRRSARTRRALRDALASEISSTGDLSQVTVTAVTDRAGVTRRTFYSHFRDIADLVGQVEGETILELRPLVRGLSEVTLDKLEEAIDEGGACPGSTDILEYFKLRSSYLSALLGDGGDPSFARSIERMVREEVTERALNGLDLHALGAFFDYYLTYAVSAEVGVLVRWLTTGVRESVDIMARLMTGLMFVRPGDLYGKQIDFDVPSFGIALLASLDTKHKETDHD
jgi:AcrR family transcriptional regulator